MGQASEQPARSLDLAEKPTAPLGATTSSKVNDQHELLFWNKKLKETETQ